MRKTPIVTILGVAAFAIGIALAATIVPSTIDQPGTQPGGDRQPERAGSDDMP